MKTLIHSVQNLPLSFASPLHRSALPVFFALSFLPGILCLSLHDFQVIHPISAFGPVVAALWLAAGLRETRVSFAGLAILITALLWSVNWLMMAGGSCCLTLGH